MISNAQAVILGLIQGLTEFVPVSSTAHLRILPAFFGWPDPGAAYSAVIQLGTLLALVIYFRSDLYDFFGSAIRGVFAGKPFENKPARMAWFMALGTVPVSVFGLLFSSFITGEARSLYVISGSLISLAIFLLFADRFSSKKREIEHVTWLDFLLIGVAQSLALIPGASRSGTTLTMGLLLGFTRESSMRISFLLSIPAIALSGVYELVKEREELAQLGFSGLFIGTAVSAIVGYLTIAGLLRYLRTHTVLIFSLYRVFIGLVILYLVISGILLPL